VGQDRGVQDDYSAKLIDFCNTQGFRYCFRNEAAYSSGEFDFSIAVGWRWLIRDFDPSRLIIFHDSLLPKYRGFAPLVNALINKEQKIGVTVLLGGEEYDKGNILLQRDLPVSYPTTINNEINRISKVYYELALDLMKSISERTLNGKGVAQEEENASYSLWRDEEDYRIQWGQDANQIEHFIQCVGFPYAGASAILNGKLVRIRKAVSIPDVIIENRTCGKVIFNRQGNPVVVCGTGLLMLQKVVDADGIDILPLTSFRVRFE
jgi:methionyl-tRNA formyltransferase